MHCEHIFGSKYLVFHRIISRPPIEPETHHLSHGNHLLWLIWQVFLCPAPGRTIFWHHSASPLSEEDAAMGITRLWSWSCSFVLKEKKPFSPLWMRADTFLFSCFKQNWLFWLLTCGNFKRLIPRLLKWRLTAPVFTDPFLFLFFSFEI